MQNYSLLGKYIFIKALSLITFEKREKQKTIDSFLG
jgi:hypothetical protein